MASAAAAEYWSTLNPSAMVAGALATPVLHIAAGQSAADVEAASAGQGTSPAPVSAGGAMAEPVLAGLPSQAAAAWQSPVDLFQLAQLRRPC